MKTLVKAICLTLFFLQFTVTQAAEYESMVGVKSAKAIFDVRVGQSQSAALHLKLIHQTYKDLMAAKKRPVFALVFIGPSVKLISKNRSGFTPEDQKSLDEIAGTVSAMVRDGMKLEVCGVALKVFNVDPASVLPEIKKVENGFISEIGYQAQGYALVPAY
ncbi:MAG: DsrE family protein [Pseudomonadota bacterium]